jgi:predicted Zn-dependent peptidase
VRRLALAAIALAGACTPAWKASLGERPDRPVRFSTFRSGLRLVVFQDPAPDRFELAVVYGAGATADPSGQEGLADLARRLSQRTRSAGLERLDRLYAAGARARSETGLDAMAFRAWGPMQALETALDVESERLARFVDDVDDEVLEATRMEASLDAPGPLAERSQLAQLVEIVLRGHPYGRPLLGTPGSLRSIRMEQVRAFAAERLQAASAVVVLASGEDPEVAARRVRDRLAAAGAAMAASTVLPEPFAPPAPLPVPPSEPAIRTLRAGRTARLWLGWVTPGTRSPEALGNVFAMEGISGLLASRLRESDLASRVRAVESDTLAGSQAGVAYARIDLTAGSDAGPVAEAVAEVLRAGSTQRKVGSLSSLAPSIAEYAEYIPDPDLTTVAQMVRAGYGPDYVETFRTRVSQELGRSELQRAVSDTFAPARMHRVLFLPREPEEGGPALALPALPVPVPRGPGYRAPGAGGAARLVRAAAPPAHRLGVDGLQVVAVRRPGTGRTTARLVYPAPWETGRAGLEILALWTARPHSPLCATGRGTFHRDHVTFSAGGAARSLDDLLELVRCEGSSTRVDASRFAGSRDALAKSLRAGREEAMERADAVLCESALPPGSCRGRLRADAVARLTPADADRWLGASLRPERAILILVGDLPPDPELDRVLRQKLGGWGGVGHPVTDPLDRAPAPRRALVVPVPGARDAWLQVARWSPGFADHAAVQALAAHLEARMAPGRGTIAFHELALRATERRGAAALLFSGGGARGSVGPLLERLEEALRRAAAGRVPPEELDAARWDVARTFLFERWSDEQLASALVEDQAALGRAETDPGSAIVSLDATRFRSAAEQLASGAATAVVVGDAAALEPQLRLAGYQMELVADAEATAAPRAAAAVTRYRPAAPDAASLASSSRMAGAARPP